MKKKILIIGGRERGLFLIKKIINKKLSLDGFIILKDDEHEVQWSEKISIFLDNQDIPNVIGKSFNNPRIKSFFDYITPDIVLVENWRTLIPNNYIEKAKYFIVFHESLLPKYRGFAPLTWPIINGDKETGVTMFSISEKVDAGDVIGQKKIIIDFTDTGYTLFKKTFNAYWELIVFYLPALINNNIKSIPQNEKLATYACMRTPEDSRINWNDLNINIYNLIRALSPPFLPGAFTYYNNKKIIISKATIPENQPVYSGRIPGRIIQIDKSGVFVLTNDGVVKIDKVLFENKEYDASLILNKMKLKLT